MVLRQSLLRLRKAVERRSLPTGVGGLADGRGVRRRKEVKKNRRREALLKVYEYDAYLEADCVERCVLMGGYCPPHVAEEGSIPLTERQSVQCKS